LSEKMQKQLSEKGQESEGDAGDPKSGNKGKEPGDKKGPDPSPGSKGSDSGQGSVNEGDSGELFEIFKQQQELRAALQELLQKNGISASDNALLKSMSQIEESLINNGLTQKTVDQMKALKHQLLKLNKATLQQGEDSKRQSNTNLGTLTEQPAISPESIKQYFNTTEILNRQRLPLRQDIKKKVQEYFKTNND